MFQGALGLALAWVIGSVVRRIILGLGVGFVVYTGTTAMIDAINSYINTNLAGMPATLVQLVNVLNVPTAFNMILAAITFHYTLVFTAKKIVFNPPT
jgi:hypothetical protein